MQLRQTGNPIPEREELEQCLVLRIGRDVPTPAQPTATGRGQ